MTEPTAYLLRELAAEQDDNRRLRADLRRARAGRDRWKAEAQQWQRHALRASQKPSRFSYPTGAWWTEEPQHAARRGEDAQTAGRAEAS